MDSDTIIKAGGEVILYQTEDGSTRINVKLQDETVWLTQEQMADLFQRDKSVISRHIHNIYEECELRPEPTIAKFATVVNRGFRGKVTEELEYYNLDVIISVGYRVKSLRGTQFRQWATQRLREYIIKGFALDDQKLKGSGGGAYWKELLDRIRDIRSSEKVLYRQVLDLYATSIDYNPKTDESIEFFKIVQNKLHYAAHGQTAAEVIYERASAEKPFMGLLSFTGSYPTKKDIAVAKNYLTEDELKILNNIVSGYFDFAEINAIEHKPMFMSDHIRQLDSILSSGGRQMLSGPGNISHIAALEKAESEYQKYIRNHLSPVEEAYLQTINEAAKIAKKNSK